MIIENHLQAMAAFVEKRDLEELNTYIQQLTNEMNQVDMIIQTGNTMIDALVNTKLARGGRIWSRTLCNSDCARKISHRKCGFSDYSRKSIKQRH